MIAAILRIFALRPLLSLAIMGIPVLILIAVGLLTIMALKVRREIGRASCRERV